jgi:hypothetical protein
MRRSFIFLAASAFVLAFLPACESSPAVKSPRAAPSPATRSPAAASPASALPSPPSGYRQYYFHDFVTGGLQGWAVQKGSTAPVSVNGNGLTVTVTARNQVTEVVSSGAMVSPGSFIQGLVYLPAAQGEIANFPAFWALSATPSEIDMVEGLTGRACSHTHYVGDIAPPGKCAPDGAFTGWHVFSALWQGSSVTFWYDNTPEGTLPLPPTTHQRLLFQNRSTGPYCPPCYGPGLYPAAARLKWVKVWHG